MSNNKMIALNKYNVNKLIFDYFDKISWRFDINDCASISGDWLKTEEWEKLAGQIRFVHSFNFVFEDISFICILHPSKRKITISTDYHNKNKIFDLIKYYCIHIDWLEFDEEIENLRNRLNDLILVKSKTISLMNK